MLSSKRINTLVMKKIVLLVTIFISISAFAQKTDNEGKQLTKFEEICDQNTGFIRFQDAKLPNLRSSSFGLQLETSVRVVFEGANRYYFYRILKPETSTMNARIAMIEYEDLVRINRAIGIMSSAIDSDMEKQPDYLVNKYRTKDGVEIGYYVERNFQAARWEVTWFIKLERYTDSVVLLRSTKEVTEAFSGALAKMEELKAQQ